MKRTAITFVAVVLATLTACSSSDSDDKSAPASTPSPSSSATVAADGAARSTGLPPKPTGQTRASLLAALHSINPSLIVDEDDAIDASRNQCASINGGGQKLDWSAQQRFSHGSYKVSEIEAQKINATLKVGFCKTA
ncbi:hypothetical protein [Streptomyces niveiscabiei]|uniref:DUF732 domain-containing protein n=1 Tax=Streptomyces niveiscabiei TaxID=164115 RepID=A0ABW9I1P4_9ACTN